jgi:16S rRNA (uracil1498-N3)-methyltransferase
MAERFYVNCPLAPGLVEVQGPEAHHLATVCRVRPGDAVYLFNGDGRQYAAEVQTVGKRSVALRVVAVEEPQRELAFRLELAVPLPKGDRAQWLVEKLTELGTTTLVPLRTRCSVVHPRDTRLDKLQRQVIEASKQCGRNVLMRVGELVAWETYCLGAELPGRRVLAHPGGAWQLGNWQAGQDVVAAVGPEGGFTDDEVAAARAAGWQVVGLGPRILRVETAALVLATLLGDGHLSQDRPPNERDRG